MSLLDDVSVLLERDAWDIDQLLDVDPALQAEVDAAVPALPDDCSRLWRRILAGRRAES